MELKNFQPNSIVEFNGTYYKVVSRCGSVIIVTDGTDERELRCEETELAKRMYYTDVDIFDTAKNEYIDIDWENGIEDTFADYMTSIDVANELLCEHNAPNRIVCVSTYELEFDLKRQTWVSPTDNKQLVFRVVNCPIEVAEKHGFTQIDMSIPTLYTTEHFGCYGGVEVDRGTWESAVCPIYMQDVTDKELDELAERLYFALCADFRTDNLTEEQINSEHRWKIEEDMIMSLPNTYYYEDMED